MTTSLTAFFITRNHEPSLARAIQSVAGLATEIIVADTGSTDGTPALASTLGARLIAIDWRDDFAAACNEAVAHATQDWLLWMNPDEELESAGRGALALAMADSKSFARQLAIRQLTHPNDTAMSTVGWEYRLFRRVPEIHFSRRLHPKLTTPAEEMAAIHHQSFGVVDAVIRRHAYLSAPTPEKIRWVVRLLEAELKDRPGQLDFTIELGRNLLWVNDPRGHTLLAEAAAEVGKSSQEPNPPTPWVGSLVEYLLSVSPEQAKCPIDRAAVRELGLRWFPRTPPVLWAVAAERFAAGDYSSAAELLERLLQMGRTGDYDSHGGFAPEIIGHSARMNLGICCLNLGRWNEAKSCFAEVMDDPAKRDAALRGYQLAEMQRSNGRNSRFD